MNRLVVKTDKLQFILVILLGLFFVPIGLWSLVSGALQGFKTVPTVVGLLSLSCFGTVLWLVGRGFRKSVKYFTDAGLVRNDGKQFAWTDLNRVVYQLRTKTGVGKSLWRTEIQFKDGSNAWLIPIKINNYAEVRQYVESLPCEHTNIDV